MKTLLIILIVLVYLMGITIAEIASKDDVIIDKKDGYTLYATTIAHTLDILLWPIILLINFFRFIYLIINSAVMIIKNKNK